MPKEEKWDNDGYQWDIVGLGFKKELNLRILSFFTSLYWTVTLLFHPFVPVSL